MGGLEQARGHPAHSDEPRPPGPGRPGKPRARLDVPAAPQQVRQGVESGPRPEPRAEAPVPAQPECFHRFGAARDGEQHPVAVLAHTDGRVQEIERTVDVVPRTQRADQRILGQESLAFRFLETDLEGMRFAHEQAHLPVGLASAGSAVARQPAPDVAGLPGIQHAPGLVLEEVHRRCFGQLAHEIRTELAIEAPHPHHRKA